VLLSGNVQFEHVAAVEIFANNDIIRSLTI